MKEKKGTWPPHQAPAMYLFPGGAGGGNFFGSSAPRPCLLFRSRPHRAPANSGGLFRLLPPTQIQ